MHCSDDELPEPEPEEVRKIKKVYLKKLKQQQDKLQKQLDEIESKKDEVYQLMTSLELSEQFCEIVKICEQIENNCE
jgi:2-hydroxy-3-keto-5-methylthiopentenyl-1-phosphate phosphatase